MIEQTPEVVAQAISEPEASAIGSIWTDRGGTGTVPSAQALEILAEVRKRESAIETKAVHMAIRAMSEDRRTPRRHQVFALVFLLAFAAFVGLVLWVASLLHAF